VIVEQWRWRFSQDRNAVEGPQALARQGYWHTRIKASQHPPNSKQQLFIFKNPKKQMAKCGQYQYASERAILLP
jgi:hypothetical protein